MELSELEGSNADEEEFEDEDAREDPPIAPGAKLAKGKSRAAPKTSPFHGDDLPSIESVCKCIQAWDQSCCFRHVDCFAPEYKAQDALGNCCLLKAF